MAAPDYVDKLPVLYPSSSKPPDTMARRRPASPFIQRGGFNASHTRFWEKYVWPRINKDFRGLYQFLNDPYPCGPNQYLQRIEEKSNPAAADGRDGVGGLLRSVFHPRIARLALAVLAPTSAIRSSGFAAAAWISAASVRVWTRNLPKMRSIDGITDRDEPGKFQPGHTWFMTIPIHERRRPPHAQRSRQFPQHRLWG